MARIWFHSGWMGVGALALTLLPLAVLGQPTETEWRTKRESIWKFFRRLPPERQQQLRDLDHHLSELEEPARQRLRQTMEAYVIWLNRLPIEDRQRVENARTSAERLEVIRSIKRKQYALALPKKRREQLARLSSAEVEGQLDRWLKEDRQRRDEWTRAAHRWDDIVINELPTPFSRKPLAIELRLLVKNLKGALSPAESEAWTLAEQEVLDGRPDEYLRLLVQMNKRYPQSFPGPRGPVRAAELPNDVAKLIRQLKLPKSVRDQLKHAEGHWPDYAMLVNDICRSHNMAGIPSLGPSNPKEFSPFIRSFIEERLKPVLSKRDLERLVGTEGRWPEYPRLLMEFSRQHGLTIPGTALPGDAKIWQKYRRE